MPLASSLWRKTFLLPFGWAVHLCRHCQKWNITKLTWMISDCAIQFFFFFLCLRHYFFFGPGSKPRMCQPQPRYSYERALKWSSHVNSRKVMRHDDIHGCSIRYKNQSKINLRWSADTTTILIVICICKLPASSLFTTPPSRRVFLNAGKWTPLLCQTC